MSPRLTAERAFLGTAALLFAASATTTVLWCESMSAMAGMPMAGGWTLSMAWLRMPDQTWLEVAAAFLGMWTVMMVAMMLPALLPMLRRYREAVGDTAPHLGLLTLRVGAGYFCIWALFGLAAFPVGAALAAAGMQVSALARAAPIASGVVVLIAGLLQLTPWKAQQLACCLQTPRCGLVMRADATTAWLHGLRLGLRCCYCCAGLSAILLVTGVMDLRVMAAVTAAITLERVVPRGEHIARILGLVSVAAGTLLILQAAPLWASAV